MRRYVVDHALDLLLVAMAVLIAASFAWLFHQQMQRATDNRNLIALNHHVLVRLDRQSKVLHGAVGQIRRTARVSCAADVAQSRALIRILAQSALQPGVTPAERTRIASWIATIPVRDCSSTRTGRKHQR